MSRQPAINSVTITPDMCSDPIKLAQALNEILDTLGYPGPITPRSTPLPESTVPSVFEFPAQLSSDFTGGPPETATAQPIFWDGTPTGDPPINIVNIIGDPVPPGNGAIIIVKPIIDPADPSTFIYIYTFVFPGYLSLYAAGCGIDITDNTISIAVDDLIGDGLVAGTGCTIAVNAGCGIEVVEGEVRVKASDLAGTFLTNNSGCALDVDYVQVTNITAIQIDGLNIQVKTQLQTVLAADTESGWTTIHTGTECE